MSSETNEVMIDTTPVYMVYPQRFYVLFVFSFLAFNQCIMWLTFSPIASNAESYYKIDEATIDLLLNWGAIIFIPCLPFTFILLNKPNGLRYCVILLAIVEFLAALVRVLPEVIFTSTNENFNSAALPFIHTGQILNAACGPFIMAPVSQLSCLWFAPHERTRATTVAIFASNFGAAIGFLISPYIVSLPKHVPRLLQIHFGLAFIACVFALSYFPAQPPSAPSAAAELLIQNPTSNRNSHNWRTFLKDVWQCLTTPVFLSLSIAGGLFYGEYGAWVGLYDVILALEHYTAKQAGWFAFGSTIAGIIGGLCLSILADTRYFQHSLKSLILISFTGYLLAVIWFDLSVQSVFYDKHILSSTVVTIGLSSGLAGLFAGAANPLIYEALAEIMYPLPESLSASILVQWINVVGVVLLFVAPNREKLVNFIIFLSAIICLVLVLITRFTYRRRDEDERKRIEKEQNRTRSGSDILRIVNESINA